MTLLEASARRDERARRFRAAMTANLMNCWVKRGHQVHVDDLVGPPRKSQQPTEGREEWIQRNRAARAAGETQAVSQA